MKFFEIILVEVLEKKPLFSENLFSEPTLAFDCMSCMFGIELL